MIIIIAGHVLIWSTCPRARWSNRYPETWLCSWWVSGYLFVFFKNLFGYFSFFSTPRPVHWQWKERVVHNAIQGYCICGSHKDCRNFLIFFCFPLSDRGKTSPKLTESVPHHPGSLAIQQFKYYKYILIDYIYMVFPICPILDAIWEFATPMGLLFGNWLLLFA